MDHVGEFLWIGIWGETCQHHLYYTQRSFVSDHWSQRRKILLPLQSAYQLEDEEHETIDTIIGEKGRKKKRKKNPFHLLGQLKATRNGENNEPFLFFTFLTIQRAR